MAMEQYEKQQAANEKVCFNCSTKETPLWRKSRKGVNLCNACGLYFRNHGQHRPITKKQLYQNQQIEDNVKSKLEIMEKIAILALTELKSRAKCAQTECVQTSRNERQDSACCTMIYYPQVQKQCKYQVTSKRMSISEEETSSFYSSDNDRKIEDLTIVENPLQKMAAAQVGIYNRRLPNATRLPISNVESCFNGVVFRDSIKYQQALFAAMQYRKIHPRIKEYYANMDKKKNTGNQPNKPSRYYNE
ncbi:GATA type transcriptional activator of nitrogen-regulated proteins [Glugoides intestinalis]